MSKILSPIPKVLTSVVLILQFFTLVRTQDVDVRLQIKPGTVDIRAVFSANMPPKDLWFMDQYAGLTGLLTERFSPVDFYDRQGYLIARKRLAPTDNFNSRNIGGIRYSVDLKPRASSFAAAHVSWVSPDGGLIMLDDLLPQGVGKSAKVTFELPAGWRLAGEEPPVVSVQNIEKAAFYVGPNLRNMLNAPVMLTLSGEWQFTDGEALRMAGSLMSEYEKTIGRLGSETVYIRVLKFPNPTAIGNWEADTRGRSVTILSSDMPFKNQSLQRLHEQLRHELFHLWIPNAVNLSGNYDWFYEGFALYQSLKTGVAVNQLRFDDFLDTLSRAYDIDTLQTKRLSLVEASKSRWSGSNTQVYARGMLVAFLCDLAMLDASNGKRSVPLLIREVFDRYRNGAAADGNMAVISVLRGHRELAPIVERYITGAEPLDWNKSLKTAGIEATTKGLSVTAKPSGRQKDTLDKLGYNNWRKLK